jgi:eukaryotic-like serine/threonine-protein kinase
VTPSNDDWIGREVANGRYKILGRIGQGSMGQVYLAADHNLETDVVLKFPVAADKGSHGAEFLDRFAREIRSLVQLSHPHIVKVFDVGDLQGQPFVVMEYLAGGSLKDRMLSGGRGECQAMPPRSLKEWLVEIAKALDFIHTQKHIHRDVKPANILFDRHGNAYLGDFGIIKALATEDADWRGNSLTAPGFLVGTPNYVAPEIVMGRPFDGRVDQYSLAMTVHEVLSGFNCMEGPTPSATVVNQTMVVPPALTELIPGIPAELSDAILRGLSKDPAGRFQNCAALAREILVAVPSSATAGAETPVSQPTSRGVPGRVPCPACQAPMPVGREHAGGRVRCTNCQATSLVSMLSSNTVQLKLVELPVPAPVSSSPPIVLSGPDDGPEIDPNAATVSVERPRTEPAATSRAKMARPAGWVGLMALGLLALVVAGIGRGLWNRPPGAPPARPGSEAAAPAVTDEPSPVPPQPDSVEINVAYGTEKQQWLEAATAAFEKTPAGRGITVNLHGMGSMEGARAVLDGPKPIPIQVWSPASSAYRDHFERQWRTQHQNQPILKADNLALTPMVFVMWRSRHEPFLKKFRAVSFPTVDEAMKQSGGWGTIANQPDWGRFKFGHTHPNQSNSGLLTLVLMAYHFAKKEHNLTHGDVIEPGFQEWLRNFEKGIARPGGSLTSSTGTLMREMVLRGPSQYDCLLIYENLAIEYLDAARDRWGELQVDYPEPNIWNEHPYYILDVPWSDPRQRAAAGEFLKFLMSAPIQERALEHGFRPGNPAVSVRFPESPFIRNTEHGIRIDLPRMCEPPKDQVVQDLLDSFRRIED